MLHADLNQRLQRFGDNLDITKQSLVSLVDVSNLRNHCIHALCVLCFLTLAQSDLATIATKLNELHQTQSYPQHYVQQASEQPAEFASAFPVLMQAALQLLADPTGRQPPPDLSSVPRKFALFNISDTALGAFGFSAAPMDHIKIVDLSGLPGSTDPTPASIALSTLANAAIDQSSLRQQQQQQQPQAAQWLPESSSEFKQDELDQPDEAEAAEPAVAAAADDDEEATLDDGLARFAQQSLEQPQSSQVQADDATIRASPHAAQLTASAPLPLPRKLRVRGTVRLRPKSRNAKQEQQQQQQDEQAQQSEPLPQPQQQPLTEASLANHGWSVKSRPRNSRPKFVNGTRTR